MRSGGQGLTDIMQHPPGAEGDPDNRDVFVPPPQQARPREHLQLEGLLLCCWSRLLVYWLQERCHV